MENVAFKDKISQLCSHVIVYRDLAMATDDLGNAWVLVEMDRSDLLDRYYLRSYLGTYVLDMQ